MERQNGQHRSLRATPDPGRGPTRPVHVSLLATRNTMAAPLAGFYEVLQCFGALGWFDPSLAHHPPFTVEIVTDGATVETASGLPVGGERQLEDVTATDVVVIPSTMVAGGVWETGRHPDAVRWLRERHAAGATLGAACSGTLLLAETGLLEGREATLHWAYEETFVRCFPSVRLRLEKELIVAGERDELIMSGAASSWHELALHLVARHVGPATARAVAKFFAFQWHTEGLAPYIVFVPRTDHGDAVVREAQTWLAEHFAVAHPVEEVCRRSGLAARSFKRRFRNATGLPPLEYVQRLRVEAAKEALEGGDEPVEEIGHAVGYEDPAFFRRLFKRIAGIPPSAYRRKFKITGCA